MTSTTPRYIISTSTGYVYGINSQHFCCTCTTDIAEAKSWKSAKSAEKWLATNADCGYGLNSDDATVIEVSVQS